MEKEDELALQLAALHRKIHTAEKNRQEILTKINSLKEACLNRDISHMNYLEKMEEKVNGLTLPEWIEYYEQYQQQCLEELENRR